MALGDEVSQLPPEARTWLRAISARLRSASAHATHPYALLAIHGDRDRETLPAALADVPEVSALPLARVRALAALVVPSLAARLEEPTAAGEAWCLLIGPTSAGVVSLSWASGGELARLDA